MKTNQKPPEGITSLGDFTTDRRLFPLAALAVLAGTFGVAAGWLLLRMIGLINNLVYYGIWSAAMLPPGGALHHGHIAAWTILIPAAGAVIIGIMARYGSEKIRGHGIPEAIEAIMPSDFRMWIAVFRRRAIARLSADSSARALLKPSMAGETCRCLARQEFERLDTLLGELAGCGRDPLLMNPGLPYVLAMAWRSFQHAPQAPASDLHPAVERAWRMMESGDGSEGLQDLARYSGLSAARLSRLFHQQMGITLVSFRNRQRVKRFLQIYGSGQRQTMLAAALEAGFGSYPQFHRVFTQVMGCSPRSYQQAELS